MANRNRIIEVMTYIIVPIAFLVISPFLGKYIDSKFFNNAQIITSNIYVLSVSILVIICGLSLIFYTIFLFKTIGKGTPNPKIPPKEFVVKGPYKLIRNPMALGGTILLIGESLFYYSIFLFIITVLYTVIIYFNAKFIEEPELIKRFGKPYEDYLKQVPRFFPFKIDKS